MGRKLRKNEYSDVVARAKMTEREYEVFKATAEVCGISVAELIRTAVFEYADRMPADKQNAMIKIVNERMNAA